MSFGTVADMTEGKHHEELLQRQADLLNRSHDAILTMQTDGRGIAENALAWSPSGHPQ
jgi:hypothetical protein